MMIASDTYSNNFPLRSMIVLDKLCTVKMTVGKRRLCNETPISIAQNAQLHQMYCYPAFPANDSVDE